MTVVVDTSVVLVLAKIGLLHLLRDLHGGVVAATTVATVAIVCHGNPDEPQPHVAFLNQADGARSDERTTTAALPRRMRVIANHSFAVVAVHSGLDAFG